MHLINKTPFQVLALPAVCHEDNNHLVVVIKASFDIGNTNQSIEPSADQQEIFLADQYWGEEGVSSLRYEADVALFKLQTDVAVIATAYPENGSSAKALDVGVSVGPLRKVIRVFGQRHWEKAVSGYNISSPQAFDSMSLCYENAYGGSFYDQENDLSSGDERNPVGKGYIVPGARRSDEELTLPNLENPNNLIQSWRDQPEPWGCGFISRSWQPRKSFTGSYDSHWQKNRSPLLPRDFDNRAYNAASTGLMTTQYLHGGEQVNLVNLSQQGPLAFTLPTLQFSIESYIRNQPGKHQTVLDTVVIEPDEKRVTMTWRSSIQVHWNLAMIDWIKVTSSSGSYNQ